MTYLITYDLKDPGKNYPAVYRVLCTLGGSSVCHALGSVFVLKSDLPINEVYNRVSSVMDRSDRLIVTELTKQTIAYLDADKSDLFNRLVL